MRRRTGQLGLDIVMVNIWEHANARAEAQHFCQVHGVDGTVLLDESGEYAERTGVRGVPTNVLVDQDGIVRAVGATSPQDLAEALDDLLGPLPDLDRPH